MLGKAGLSIVVEVVTGSGVEALCSTKVEVVDISSSVCEVAHPLTTASIPTTARRNPGPFASVCRFLLSTTIVTVLCV